MVIIDSYDVTVSGYQYACGSFGLDSPHQTPLTGKNTSQGNLTKATLLFIWKHHFRGLAILKQT